MAKPQPAEWRVGGCHLFGDQHLHSPVGNLLGQVDIEMGRLVPVDTRQGESESSCEGGECSALRQEGDYRADKSDIEEYISVGHPSCGALDGEDNRYRSFESNPRDIGPVGTTESGERQEREPNGERPGKEDEDSGDDECRHSNAREVMRLDEETENKEHEQLTEPGEPVDEAHCGAFMRELTVAKYESSYIDGEITVSPEERGGRVDEDAGRENHDRIEAAVVERHTVHDCNHKPGKSESDDESEEQAPNDGGADSEDGGLVPLQDYIHHRDSDEIGHRVVAAGLKFEQRSEIMSEPHPFVAEDGEDRRRVGRRHCGGHEEGER